MQRSNEAAAPKNPPRRLLANVARYVTSDGPSIASVVAGGLLRRHKALPSWLFYDTEGSRLFEEITALPEYYPCRAEQSILEERSEEIVASLANGAGDPSRDRLTFAELGAGTATKSQLLLHAAVARQGEVNFLPSDVSASALLIASERLAREEPAVRVCPFVAHHERALRSVRILSGRQVLLFLGSSIGNYPDKDARTLLGHMRTSLRPGGALLLGTDLRKSPAVLVPAYDDTRGVTAAFNKNVLTRLNRELGASFALERFDHVAVWNEAASRMEMHLESRVDQVVRIRALKLNVAFRSGERIHTESSVKYDRPMVERLLGASGFALEQTFLDRDARFALHLARAVS